MEVTNKKSRVPTTTLSKKMKVILEQLEKYTGNISMACKACNISRRQFYNYVEKNEKFKTAVDDIRHSIIDLIETTAIAKAINEKDTRMLIFLMKVKCGYRESQVIESKGSKEIITYDVSNLSKEEINEILENEDDENEFE